MVEIKDTASKVEAMSGVVVLMDVAAGIYQLFWYIQVKELFIYSRCDLRDTGGAETFQSARRMAVRNDVLCKEDPEHIFPKSVVGVGSIEQMSDSPSRLKTTGEQIVASPIEAASSGTGTMYNAFEVRS